VETFDALLREAMLVTAILAVPVLVAATLVGASVAVVQAATQVQEQTLTLLPKMLAVGALVALFGRFGLTLCEQLFREIVARAAELARG